MRNKLFKFIGSKGQAVQKGTAVSDADGNTYETVIIGEQVWMTEDLRTTRYNDGTLIPLVTDNKVWSNLGTPAMCWYDNDAANKNTYGGLYNGYAVETGKLAPKGWHVATHEEWIVLEEFLIANYYNWDKSKTGNKIAKSLAAKSGWRANDEAGTIGYNPHENNLSGFSALPAGCRDYDKGTFEMLGNFGYWWCDSVIDSDSAWCRTLGYFDQDLSKGGNSRKAGFSVRCLRDELT